MLANQRYEYEVKQMIESHKRSIMKALTWRILGLIFTTAVAFLFTREAVLSAGIGISDSIIKLFGYYLHERIWNKINFGRRKIGS
jgi:uncharacterized membrane protein